MSKFGSAAKGAGTGAVVGSALGPWGTAAGAAGGAIYGWLSDTSDEQAAAEKQKTAGMQAAANTYQGYRPQVMGARQQGLQQKLSAYSGAADSMGLMYGNNYNPKNYAPDLGKLPDPSSYAPQVQQPAPPVQTQQAAVDATINSSSRPTSTPADNRPQNGYDAERTKELQHRLGRSDVWVDGAGVVHQVGATQAGLRLPGIS